MSQSLNLKIKGLFTSYNELSEVPEGALLVADNIDILKDSIAEPRRGFDRLAAGYTDATQRTAKTWFYQDKQFAHHGPLGSEGTISYFSGGTWHTSGSYSAITGTKLRALEANQNLYVNTSTGIIKLDAYNSTPILSGAYKALDVAASTSASASTWLTNNYRVAYRVVWGYKDLNKNLILGAVSQRESFKNTSGVTKAVDLRITIPTGVTTSWFVQVYRSSMVDNSAATVEPSDELGLVYETNPVAGDITQKYIDITDIVPDDLRGATIYTAASQEGLAFQNERPPLAKDIAVFRDCVFFFNTTSKHRYFLTLLSATGTNGLADDDTLIIGGITYTAKNAETITSGYYKRYTAGSASQNITDTALSLVRVINRYASSTVYAYYLSGPDDLPGKILIEERGIGGSSFALTATDGVCWSPSLPTSGTTQSSTNDRFKNGLSWSKPNQPESVPLGNFAQVGNKDTEGQRCIALRDALYLFKDGEGIYKLTGYYPNFQIELLDSSASLIGNETPGILNNQIFCLTTQGATVVADGTKVISRPIEQEILSLFGSTLDLVKSIAFGIAYETDRKYYLFLPETSADTTPTQAFVFNTFTNTWVRHVLSKTCGVLHNNYLYLGDADSNFINVERKTYSYLDYVDYGFTTSISAIASNIATISSGVDDVAVGDVLYQSSTIFSLITAVDTANNQVTVNTDPGFSAASVDVLEAIDTEIKWVPITTGNPGITKQYHTALLLLKASFNGTGYLTFSSDLSIYDESVPLVGLGNGLYGLEPYGDGPWGGVTPRKPMRQWVPRNKQRCSLLTVSFTHAYGLSPWQVEGLSLFGTPGSENVSDE